MSRFGVSHGPNHNRGYRQNGSFLGTKVRHGVAQKSEDKINASERSFVLKFP